MLSFIENFALTGLSIILKVDQALKSLKKGTIIMVGN